MRVRACAGRGAIKGTNGPNGKARRVAIAFDDDVFDLLNKQVKITGWSFSAVVRQYLRLGMGLK